MNIHFKSMGFTHHTFERPGSDIKKSGYLRKLKTMKKKFFVLRSTSSSGPARLEYYSSEKKFQAGTLPKRSIQLHTCFNINRRWDSRNGRWGIVLYTVQDSFAVVTDTQEEQESWLAFMLEYQNEYLPEGSKQNVHYEHVWQVTMQPRGLGQAKGNKGPYRLCLNSTTVSLFKVNSTEAQFVIQLMTIRVVAHNENSVWLTVGNYASTGPGELYFTVESAETAKDIHTRILDYMSSLQDTFHKKGQQFGHACPREVPISLYDGFGGPLQSHLDSRKFHSVRSSYTEEASQDFIKDSHLSHRDAQIDLLPLCSSNLDGEVNAYTEFSKSDFASMMSHQSLHSSYPSSMHTHNFSDLQFLTHLPTVKEGGSGEGYLLSDNPCSSTGSSEMPRPEPATCLLYDDSDVLPPRTYSLGSKPVKNYQSYCEMGSRKGMDNEMSRATSAPHILKGRREREYTGESQTPAISPLSMSLQSDDSDSFADFIPIRPRTASDSFNYRPRTSSFGKLQQNCRPRSSSYGQGKRPVININKLRLEKAMMSQDPTQRISRESSLLSSFESLRVSRDSLRRTSQELRQSGASNTEDADLRSTPSPQMRNTSDLDVYMDLQLGAGKRKTSPHRVRTDSTGSGRSLVMKTKSADHQRHQPHPQQINEYANMAPSSGGSDSSQPYVNVEYGTRLNETKPLAIASQIQPSSRQDSAARYRNVDSSSRNKRSAASRSVSMENVDTYFISDFHLSGNKPRTGSCGAKDKNILRPESTQKPSTDSASSSSAFSSTGTTHPWPVSSAIFSGITHPPASQVSLSAGIHQQQPSPAVSSLGFTHQQPSHPLVSSSTRTFGSSDSIRKTASMEKPVVLGRDFRKKSGSTGSRPTSTKASLPSGKEQFVSGTGIMPSRKPPSTRFTEEPTYQLVDFSPASSRSDCLNSHSQSIFPHSGLSHSSQPMNYSGRSGPVPSSDGATSIHSKTVASPTRKEDYVLYNPPISSSGVSSHIHNHHQSQLGTSRSQLGTSSHHHSPYIPQSATSSSSSLPSQTRQIVDDGPDYVTFDLKKVLQSVPAHMLRNQRFVETKDDHMGFKNLLSYTAPWKSSSGCESSSSKDQEAYVDYQPRNDCYPSTESRVPSSATSYIQRSSANEAVGKPKLKYQHMSLETATSANKSHNPTMGTLFANQTFTSDSIHQSDSNCTVAQHLLPPVPPLPASAVTPQRSPLSLKETAVNDSGTTHFSPDSSAVKCSSQDNASIDVVESTSVATSCASLQQSHDINSLPMSSACVDVPKSCMYQSRQSQQQSQTFQRQLSAPAYSSFPANQHIPVLCEPQTHVQFDRTQSTDKTCTPSDSDSGTSGSCNTHLQLIGTSNPSHKSCSRLSPDSGNESCIKGHSSSDLSACSADGLNKCQLSGSERPMFSPNQNTVSSGKTSLSNVKSSELNVPTKARTRHSLGDIMSIVGMDRWKRQGNKTSSDLVSSSNPCYRDSLQLPREPRSRHSLSDLDFCQHTFSEGLASLSSKPCTADGSCRAGSESDGICGSTNRNQFPKSVNRF